MRKRKVVRKRRVKGRLDKYAGKWIAWIVATQEVIAVGETFKDIASFVVTPEDKKNFDPRKTPSAFKVPEKDTGPIYILKIKDKK